MEKVHTEIVGDAHAYTRSDVPWAISTARTDQDRLVNYISGGGMRIFGRTVHQEEVKRRQVRFLVAAGILGAAWFLLLVV
ncbi:MAG: hypothetical protein KBT68_01295 [bacterium]|nr:hypothetical protein [Candidatus Colisoma equi]